MEWIFEILIPKNDLEKVGLEEILTHWGEETFSQEPRKFKFKSKIVFHEVTQMGNHYQNLLGDEIEVVDYIILCLEFGLIYDLYAYANINDNQEVINNSPIICLINHLYEKLDSFYLINELADEFIGEKYIIQNSTEAINVLINSLKWSDAKSIVIIKTKNKHH